MRATRRHLAAAMAGGLLLTACAGERTEEVAGVSIEVPRGWNELDVTTPGDVLGMARFSPSGEPTTTLQVVVGCGEEDADELTIAAASQPREELVVTDAEDAVSVEVPGMEAARRTTMTLGAGRVDDAQSLRLAGLYASGSGALVLVELTAAIRDFDASQAEEVLDTVEADTDVLAEACEGD